MLDEFALILHPPYVYWANEGRLARPGSIGARRFDDRWRPAIDRWDSVLGGVPCHSNQPG